MSSRVSFIPSLVLLKGLGMGTELASVSGASLITGVSWYCTPSLAGEPILPLYLQPLHPVGLSVSNFEQVAGPEADSLH